ncbi:hypothetical protein OSB04_029491 [Centaurea solstitialis]|uniref:Retroviral polymerase SH3-like domain-containing protein n=1 Tax=Centaurea solstitialis TaxID=347529 RepID=A0AA38SHR3_9ASTR|nr:hypothetical protein OSB04_029491 [Centaurea solstitialis]
MPKHFWAEAAKWACYVLNRCMSRSLDEKVPEEFWKGSKPSVEKFKVFGCIGHVHIPAQLRTKLDARSHKCVFLGISQESKAYRLYDPSSKKVVISRDVKFDEDATWDWSKENQKVEEFIIEDDEKAQGRHLKNFEDEARSPARGNSQTQSTENVPNSLVLATTGNLQDQSVPITQLEPSTRTDRPPAWMDDYCTDQDPLFEDEADFAMYSAMDDPMTYEEACKD